MTLCEGDVGAFRAKPCAIGLLAALAACGRFGYDGPALIGTHEDGPVSSRDGDPDGPPVDPAPPDVLPPDVPPADTAMADVTFIPPDMSAPPDLTGAPPPDAGVDGPITSRTVIATGQNPTPRRGGSGPGVVDLCPAGRPLVGFEGTQAPSSGVIRSMTGVCATVTLPVGGAPAMPWELVRLPARGDTSGTPWERLCPDRHVLVGFDGNAGSAIGQLVLVCAPIALAPSGNDAVLGSDIELDDVGARAANDFLQADCPAGQAARGAETRAVNVLEAFGLICGTLAVR